MHYLCAKCDSIWLEHILPHFRGYACDRMCGALVTFQRNFKKCGKSGLDTWRSILVLIMAPRLLAGSVMKKLKVLGLAKEKLSVNCTAISVVRS